MPISGCHDLPLATFNLPSRNNLQNKPNSAPIKPMSFPSSAWECVPRSSASHSHSCNSPQGNAQHLLQNRKNRKLSSCRLSCACERIPLRHRSNLQEKNNIVIPEFSAWLTLVLEQCRAENIRNLPRERAPTPLFPERRPREACSMPISGCHDLPLATFNLPSRNRPQNKQQQRPHKTISRASGLPRPYFQNADPGRHAPCQNQTSSCRLS